MPHVAVRLTLQDYAKWRPVFDGFAANRKASGSKGGTLYRNADNTNEVVAVFEWDDLNNARKFYQSPELREAMQKAGLSGPPDLRFLDDGEKLSA